MAHSRLYRSFLILQEAEKGYSIASDKPISAYTKIEGKNDSCKISFYAQNLKKDNYCMLLICGKKGVNRNISLGPLNINEQGRAEVSGDYDINNISGTGIPMNSISGAAIVILNDDKINVIMKGYMNGEKVPREWNEFPLVEGIKGQEEMKQPISSGEQSSPSETIPPQEVHQTSPSVPVTLQEGQQTSPLTPSRPQEEQQTLVSGITIPQEEERTLPSASVSPQGEEQSSPSETILPQEEQQTLPSEVIIPQREINDEVNSKSNTVLLEENKISQVQGEASSSEQQRSTSLGETPTVKAKESAGSIEAKESTEAIEPSKNRVIERGDISIDNKLSEQPSSSSCIEEIAEKNEDSQGLLEDLVSKEESGEGINRKVNIASSKNSNEISMEELQVLKAFIKEQELRLGIIQKEEESLPKNLVENLETKESRSANFHKVSPEIKKDIEDLNSIDIKAFTRTLEENEFDSYEKAIEESKNKLMENNDSKLEDNFNLRGSVGKFFLELAKDFEPLDLESSEIKYCKWYRVPVDSVDNLCDISNYNKYTIAYYPMMNYYPYIKNHKHFILGFKGDRKGSMKYLVYGIPGGKGRQEQPYGGKSGFVTWIPCDKDEEKGYWLMFYDFKNSVIVVPIRQEE